MAVVLASTVTVKPDRFEEFLELNRKSKPLLEKAGAKNFRVLAGLVAGEATGSFVVTFEADDFAAWGSMMGNFLGDPEGQAFMSSLSTGASPIPGYQSAIWVDVPL
jgi:hypothetical protein